MMLKIRLQQDDDDFVIWLEGEVEDVAYASQSLAGIVPAEYLAARFDGLLCIRGEAGKFLQAWLYAIQHTNRFAKVVWLPIAGNA